MQDLKQKNGIHPVLTAVGGAVVGAGIAIAGVLALKDRKTNQKVNKILDDVTSKASGVSKKLSDTADAAKNAAAKTIEKTQDEVKKIVRESK